MVASYQTLYKQAIDTQSPDYRAPFNTLASASGWRRRKISSL